MISESKKPKIIAHRGASGHAPETTLEAYRLALQMGADGVEMDVRRLRDGTMVAIHDPNIKRTTNGKGKISEITLAQVKTLDAGSWFNKAYPKKARTEYVGLKVPTLQEIIDLIKESSAELYMEIKDAERYKPCLEPSLLSIVIDNVMEKRTRFLSFSAQSICRIKALDASIRTGLLISTPGGNPVQQALRVSADELAIQHNLATHALIDVAHNNGLSISVWTVDEQKDFQRVIRLGVDGIITNYPDRINLLLGGITRRREEREK
jgi:glycerophosphoryl diester phosphodiesterase